MKRYIKRIEEALTHKGLPLTTGVDSETVWDAAERGWGKSVHVRTFPHEYPGEQVVGYVLVSGFYRAVTAPEGATLCGTATMGLPVYGVFNSASTERVSEDLERPVVVGRTRRQIADALKAGMQPVAFAVVGSGRHLPLYAAA